MNKEHIKNDSLREEYEKIIHKSGLTVYLFPKKLTTTYAGLTVRFGSLDNMFRLEGEEKPLAMPDGIAHFLEHKMFACADNSDAFDKFAAVGASANAYTSYEATTYLFSANDEVDKALSILFDLVFNPYFTEENVKKEVGIIGQEIKMYEDSPSTRLYETMMELLYVNHGVRTNICGTQDSIAAITPALLMRCYNAFYRPSNMIFILVGDIDTDAVLATLDRLLPTSVEAGAVERVTHDEPPSICEKHRTISMDISRQRVCLGVKDTAIPSTPRDRMRRAMAISLGADLIFGESAPFYERLYREGLISKDFSAFYESFAGIAHLLLSAETDDPDRLIAELKGEFARISTLQEQDEEALRDDFLRLRKVHYAEYVKDFDSTEEIATALLSSALDRVELFETGQLILSIELSEVLAIFRDFFSEVNTATALIVPMKGSGKAC